MKLFFRHKANDAPPIPDSHKRVMTWADRCNDKLMHLDEERTRVMNEIADSKEELRQIEAVIAAYRAGLTVIVDDPTLAFVSQTQSRAHIEDAGMSSIEHELELSTVDLLK